MKNNTEKQNKSANTKVGTEELRDQNSKIAFITDDMMVIGVDVGSENHYARAFTNRKIELSSKPFKFTNTKDGFEAFKAWAEDLAKRNGMKFIIVALEPTGHYWMNLGTYIKDSGMILAQVNPAAVKKSKELDDNDPSKNDRKDPKVIAGLASDGRYCLPYIPEGVYAEIRELSNQRIRAVEELTRTKNRVARWFSIYFPEYLDVYGSVDNVTGTMILRKYPLPQDIVAAGIDGILKVWSDNKVRGTGRRRAEKLYEAAKNSIGRKEASKSARMELMDLLNDLETYESRVDRIMEEVTDLLWQIPNTRELLNISGVGTISVLTFVAEVGDISRIKDAKALQKLAGLAIVADSSGKHNGESGISYRGRKRLRWCVYQLAISLISRNRDFAAIHAYYTTRAENPLKKMQSLIAVGCKAMRVFYKILTTGTPYDGHKMTSDIIRPAAA